MELDRPVAARRRRVFVATTIRSRRSMSRQDHRTERGSCCWLRCRHRCRCRRWRRWPRGRRNAGESSDDAGDAARRVPDRRRVRVRAPNAVDFYPALPGQRIASSEVASGRPLPIFATSAEIQSRPRTVARDERGDSVSASNSCWASPQWPLPQWPLGPGRQRPRPQAAGHLPSGTGTGGRRGQRSQAMRSGRQ
jgi:hypothetical protein